MTQYFSFDDNLQLRNNDQPSSVSHTYFDALYEQSPDPWGFSSKWYEARKYALTLAALPLARYRRIFEPGCSIGVLTHGLAGRADHVVAVDISPRALEHAQARGLPHNVELDQMQVPQQWPVGEFDLIVMSELGSYLNAADLDLFIRRSLECLSPEGHLVAVHWRHDESRLPTSGPTVHETLRNSELVLMSFYCERDFLLDVFGRSEQASFAGP